MQIITKNDFNEIKDKFLDQINDQALFMREVSFALQHIHKNPYLNKCTRESMLRSVYNISLTGLTLNPVSKEAYIVPRNIKNGNEWITEAVLEPSYMGLIRLLTDTGSVRAISAHLVYKKDEFSIDVAQNEISHKLSIEDRGDFVGAYAIAVLVDGTKQVEWMDQASIDDIKGRSESYKAFKAGRAKSTIWESDYGEMARKTVIKRIYKYLPKSISTGAGQIENAIDLDNQHHGFRDVAQWDDKSYAYNLLEQCGYSTEEHQHYESIIDHSTYKDEIQDVINVLNESPKILNGSRQKDIKKELDEKLNQPNS